jgi:putative nucleotidyltransferase with HDIG domain
MNERVDLPEWPLAAVRTLAAQRGLQVWPVGGVVRDAILGRPLHDWDFAVDRDARSLARAVADALGGAYYHLDPERDVGRVILEQPAADRLELDFAALRGPDLEADLSARDFTINAMALGPQGEVIDPHGGLEDLEERRVRSIGPEALDEDPVRMLRAVRLAAEMDLRLEARTAAWIIQRAHTLPRVAVERVRDEFVRILAAPAAASHVHVLDELTLLVQVIPAIGPLRGQPQSPPHRFDVWWHTLLVLEAVEGVVDALAGKRAGRNYVDASPQVWDDVARRLERFAEPVIESLTAGGVGGLTRDVLLRLAALCHDVGKPPTSEVDEEGRYHFYGHERHGARTTAEWMEATRFSRAATRWVKTVVEAHLRPGHLSRIEGPVSRRAIYRYFRATGEAGVDVTLLSLADHLATYGPQLEPDRWERRLSVVERLLSHFFERPAEAVDPPRIIDGQDLMDELGLEEGPLIGRLLTAVREAQAAGEVSTRAEALALARSLAQEQ